MMESDREKVHDKCRSSAVKMRQRSFTSPLVMSRDREQVKDEHIIFTTGSRNEVWSSDSHTDCSAECHGDTLMCVQ